MTKFFLLFISLFFTGCKIDTYHNSNCNGKYTFANNVYLYKIDDKTALNHYSDTNFPKDEYFLYVCNDNKKICDNKFKGFYYQGWKITEIKNHHFKLTGKYVITTPFLLDKLFVPKTRDVQIEIDNKKYWISDYTLEYVKPKDKCIKNYTKSDLPFTK
ncbi:hypothetical protein C3L23_02425 [Nautilia sp. PV-1]|uniref:hypothetical protein n=1 Tax=Nautilia sp. PV-1 TaxID=2579250 RepID=UPI000FDC1F2C|nr:hypothetical protein [Nautilia sp. PV-1]AZV46164.1 hypothetical protein C3L23_02425 [Nautilia sp. PV-1]